LEGSDVETIPGAPVRRADADDAYLADGDGLRLLQLHCIHNAKPFGVSFDHRHRIGDADDRRWWPYRDPWPIA
jgi:hypothetical protein